MTKAIACLLAAGLLASCGGPEKPKTKPIVNKDPVPGKVGEACKQTDGSERGTCEAGLMCADLPGGYCIKACPCGGGEACADTASLGDVCGKACSADSDCRTGEGYACDPTWKTCTVGDLLAPKAPVCETAAPPLPRKTFGPVTQMTSTATPGKYQSEPTTAIDKDGNLIVVYVAGEEMGKPNNLGAGVYTTKDTVEGDISITIDDRGNHSDPWLQTDRNGKLYLTWLGSNGTYSPKNMLVGVSTSDEGDTWGFAVAAHDAATDCAGNTGGCLDKPMIVIGPDRNNPNKDVVYAFYYSAVTGAMKVTHSLDGGITFSTSSHVGKGAYGDALITSSGKLHVVYVGATSSTGNLNRFGDAGNAILYVNSGDGGATFSSPIKVSGEGEQVPFYFSNPQIIADVQRALLYVVYPAGTSDGKWDIIMAVSKDGGLSWKRQTVNDDAPCANHMLPAAALDAATGKLHVSWNDNRSGTGSVAYASCQSGGGKCSPNELVSDRPFASYGFVRQSPRSMGDYNAMVIDNKRKLLHVVWTQTVEENGAPIARIFHSSTKLK